MSKLVVTLLILAASSISVAAPLYNDLDVSIYHSNKHKGMETVEIYYRGCTTFFTLKYAELDKAINGDHGSTVLDSMTDKAIERANNGCH